MNPVLETVSDIGDVYTFTLSGINVSLANALRRIVLSEIPTVCFYTENNSGNQCTIEINTTRLHNEILKQRLSCIPVHEKDMTLLPGNYILELDMKNETDNIIIVTTEHFRIKNKTNGNYLTKDEVKRIFPANAITNQYIDFARLRPKISAVSVWHGAGLQHAAHRRRLSVPKPERRKVRRCAAAPRFRKARLTSVALRAAPAAVARASAPRPGARALCCKKSESSHTLCPGLAQTRRVVRLLY
jgi:hypothetical protein